uniref:Testis development related protein n=1 Tax=Sinocyclocheilus grahami TaxID=75366 RepID=A0A672N1Z4_SINGR
MKNLTYVFGHKYMSEMETAPCGPASVLPAEYAASFSLRSAKKNWEDDKSKDKAHCLWDSITMTMKQITPTRKIDKIEGWEPPQLNDGRSDSSMLSLSLPHSLGLPSWVGLGSEEDSSRYASLTESQTGGPAQWAARARDKLAAVRRRSPAGLSESNWEGLK